MIRIDRNSKGTVAMVYAFGLRASFIPALLAACKSPVEALGK